MTASVHDYVRDGAAIYARSFAIIRAEGRPRALRRRGRAGRGAHDPRLRHDRPAPGPSRSRRISRGAATRALAAGAPILCDTRMVADGVTRARLPSGNPVLCTLGDPGVPALAARLGTTRSAAALELWRERLGGALVAVGNAPTALFRLLELLDEGAPRPAAVIGVPVGFVGAAESKAALAADGRVPYLAVHGRRGGSAMAAAAVNALASPVE